LWFNIQIEKVTKNLFCHIFQAYIKYGDEVFRDNIQVRHFNNDYLCNYWENILIGTSIDNQQDVSPQLRSLRIRKAHITMGHRVLSDKEIDEVRLLYLQGNLTLQDIARMYNCSRFLVFKTIKRKILSVGI